MPEVHEKHYKPGCPECIAARIAEREALGIRQAGVAQNKMVAPPATAESAAAATSPTRRAALAKKEDA